MAMTALKPAAGATDLIRPHSITQLGDLDARRRCAKIGEHGHERERGRVIVNAGEASFSNVHKGFASFLNIVSDTADARLGEATPGGTSTRVS